jgi:hypothetical protein
LQGNLKKWKEINARLEDAKASKERANAEMKASQERANAEIKAGQEKVNSKMKAAYEELTADLKAMVAWMAANQTEMLACPDISEADVITFEKSSEEMDATRLEANPEETEAAVERQDLFKKRDERQKYRVSGGPAWRTPFGCTTSPRG